MTKISIEEMKREQVIHELRKHAHPQWFHSILSWSTSHLKGLLAYYTEEKKEETKKPFSYSSHTSSEGAALGCHSCTLHEKIRAQRALKTVGLEIRKPRTFIGIDFAKPNEKDSTVFVIA